MVNSNYCPGSWKLQVTVFKVLLASEKRLFLNHIIILWNMLFLNYIIILWKYAIAAHIASISKTIKTISKAHWLQSQFSINERSDYYYYIMIQENKGYFSISSSSSCGASSVRWWWWIGRINTWSGTRPPFASAM